MGARPLLEVLKRTESWFSGKDIPSARLDAELLLAHVLGVERLQLYLMYDRPLSDDELDRLRPLVRRRGERVPVAYLTGHKGFHALDLVITEGVLVPRPDTETLVEAALSALRASEGDDPIFVADVGCGSGAVGLALAAAEPRVRVYATDLADAALACTRRNVQALGLSDRVAVLRGPLLTPIPEARPIDWVVSNPPYIRSGELPHLQPEVRDHEPRLALDGGPDGLAVYRALLPAAVGRARQGVLVEIGHDQGEAVADLFREHGLVDVRVLPDPARHDRVVSGRIPSAATGVDPTSDATA